MEEKSVVASTQEKQQIIQLIVFRVGDEEFGVPIGAVQEIIKVGIVTPIPDSPSFIKGLINVRGDIVAIIDVRARFSLPTEEEPSKHIVIVNQEGSLFGLMVNEVLEVLRVQKSDIKTPPQLMTKMHEDYVYGVITHDARLIILLDVNKVLSEDELVRLASLTREKPDTNAIEEYKTLDANKLEAKKNKVNGKKNIE
jgi:purine-binding chemotaxis protein CheW